MQSFTQGPFAVLFFNSPAGLAVSRRKDSSFIEVNEAFCRLFGYAREHVIGKSALGLDMWHDPQERKAYLDSLKSEGATAAVLMTFRARDKSQLYLEVSSALTQFSGEDCFLHMFIDRTKSKQAEMLLETALSEAQRFREALDNVPAYVYIKDANHRYTYANQPTLSLFQCEVGDLVGKNDGDFFPPETAARICEIDNRVLSGATTAEEIDINAPHGGKKVFREVKAPIHENESVWGLVGISTDITVHKELEAKLEHQAYTDYLTGLPNRNAFFDMAQKEFARSKRYGEPLSIAMFDLDHFKMINDTYGHEIGDAVLKEVAAVCRHTLRESDIIGRIGGEEFVVMWPKADAVHGLEAGERLREAIDTARIPLERGLPVHFTASLGVATLEEADTNFDVFLNRADKALYEAKRTGRNKVHLA